MNFNFETQGAITYLVCELEPVEQIDSLTLGMLTNNHIPGLAPVLYTEMNGQRFLKYNISAKITSTQFFSAEMNRHRTLSAFQHILEAICSADDYMIDPNCFSVAPEHIFINVSSCETALICIPVVTDKEINTEVAALFKQIMDTTHFAANEPSDYVTRINAYLNNGTTFNVYGFRDLISNLQSSRPSPQNTPVFQQVNPVQQTPGQAPSFDSTISIDDMPGMMGQKPQQPVAPQSIPVTPSPAPFKPTSIPPQPQPIVKPTPNVSSVTKVNTPPVNNMSVGGFKPTQQPPIAVPKPPVSNAGFAIPGQSPKGNIAIPAASPSKPKKEKAPKPQKVKADGDKKMSFFGLLAHYNKENAEIYKKQKNEKKNKSAAKAPVLAPPTGIPAPQPVRNGVPISGVPQQQPFTPQQYQPPIQPLPIQNSFNETTVLSPMMSGDTTVLSAVPTSPSPHLVRLKSGERIEINKPVFRIGKEKSYVDYFIADNTAISRSHANIHTENGEYFIEDTNSTNHTYINGAIINSNVKTKLVSGDKVRLANEDFTFMI